MNLFAPEPVPPPTPAEICRLFSPDLAATKLLAPDLSPQQFFDRLVAAGLLADARKFLAHALPPRRAIWWAALCLHHATSRRPFDTPAEEVAFESAVRWLVEPNETTRRATEAAGWAASPTTEAGILAMACFLSGGSISLPGLPAVLPKPHVVGRLVGVVVYLASVRFDPAGYLGHLAQYLTMGVEVAAGHNLPPGGPAVEPPTEVRAGAVDARAASRVAAFLAGGAAAAELRPGEALFQDPTGDRP